MSVSNYITKADKNKRVAVLAEENDCFEAAISRHYYHFFLRLKFFLIQECNVKESSFSPHAGFTHVKFRELLRDELDKKSDEKGYDVTDINEILFSLEDLCDLRGIAEYQTRFYNQSQFNSSCKGFVNKLNRHLTKISII